MWKTLFSSVWPMYTSVVQARWELMPVSQLEETARFSWDSHNTSSHGYHSEMSVQQCNIHKKYKCISADIKIKINEQPSTVTRILEDEHQYDS